MWTRSDGAVRVTSPVIKAVFPGRPEQKLEKGNGNTLDGKDVWLYQFVYDLGDDGQLRLELSGLGRNAGGSDKEPLIPLLAKIGKGAAAAHAAVRAACAFLDDDRPLGPDIEAVAALIADGTVAA